MSKPTFEEVIGEIDNEINKRRAKWNLTALAWLDFNDVAQIIRIHIYNKWHLYNWPKPLAPWVNTIISNQIRNLIRNNYGNYSRPCLKCAAAESDNLCSIYEKQSNVCPLVANWEKTKKSAHDTKLPVSLENHTQEVFNMSHDAIDIERSSANLHDKMHKTLKPAEWKVYKLLYIDHCNEEEVAKLMGYRTSEIGRKQGYKQIKNIKKAIMVKVHKCLNNGDIDIV